MDRLQSISERINVSDLIKKHAVAQAKATPARSERHHEVETRDARVIQRAQPIAPIQRKTRLETVTFEIDPTTATAIAQIGNKKASAQAVTLCKTGTVDQMIASLNEQKNPFPELPKWLNIMGDKLAGPAESFTRAGLKAAFMEQLGWKDQTAGSHVSIAVAMAVGLGIVVEHEGSFILSNPKDAQ